MISNFRDLGGLQNKEGRIIPSGRLYRSANLYRATEDDLTGISAVIDLRTETERQRMPDQIPDGIAYHHIPIFDLFDHRHICMFEYLILCDYINLNIYLDQDRKSVV